MPTFLWGGTTETRKVLLEQYRSKRVQEQIFVREKDFISYGTQCFFLIKFCVSACAIAPLCDFAAKATGKLVGAAVNNDASLVRKRVLVVSKFPVNCAGQSGCSSARA